MFVSFSLILWVCLMMSLSISNMLLKWVYLDMNKMNKINKKADNLKKTKNYNQLEFVKLKQKTDDINFNLIYHNIITFIIMGSVIFMIEGYEPLTVLGHRLGFLGILLLIIIEGITLNYILHKIGIK